MKFLVSSLGFIALTIVALKAQAEITIPHAIVSDNRVSFAAANGEVGDMISLYAKASGQKFIVDPGVRGKVTIHLPAEVSTEEAFNVLCDALATNGFAVVAEGDTYIVKSARNAQRDAIPTYTELPPVRPNLMVTYVIKLKYISAEDVNKRLRILPSKDGEMTPFEPSNSIIISDFTPNINRIAEVIKQLDTPEAQKYQQTHPKPPPLKPAAPKEPVKN